VRSTLASVLHFEGGISFWGAHAASVRHSVAGRMHWQRKHAKRRRMFAASCRELQASGLCSPEFTIRWNQIRA
jgi:hypothetical protein